MARTARSRRASSVNNAVGDMDFTETGTPLQETAPEPVMPEPSNELSEPVQPTSTKSSARRSRARASLVHFDENATTDPPSCIPRDSQHTSSKWHFIWHSTKGGGSPFTWDSQGVKYTGDHAARGCLDAHTHAVSQQPQVDPEKDGLNISSSF
ncbi:hypothetical protein MRX96_038187 [Rhipicephalus microplus]